jgi:hypothetical protein
MEIIIISLDFKKKTKDLIKEIKIIIQVGLLMKI